MQTLQLIKQFTQQIRSIKALLNKLDETLDHLSSAGDDLKLQNHLEDEDDDLIVKNDED